MLLREIGATHVIVDGHEIQFESERDLKRAVELLAWWKGGRGRKRARED